HIHIVIAWPIYPKMYWRPIGRPRGTLQGRQMPDSAFSLKGIDPHRTTQSIVCSLVQIVQEGRPASIGKLVVWISGGGDGVGPEHILNSFLISLVWRLVKLD